MTIDNEQTLPPCTCGGMPHKSDCRHGQVLSVRLHHKRCGGWSNSTNTICWQEPDHEGACFTTELSVAQAIREVLMSLCITVNELVDHDVKNHRVKTMWERFDDLTMILDDANV